jgi:Tol biopolymer transport system component
MPVLIALLVLLVAPPAALATFPGRNGDLLVTERSRTHGFDDASWLMRIDPGSGTVTRTEICAQASTSDFPGPRCPDVGPPAASPDGRWVAFATRDVVGEPPYSAPWPPSVRVLPLAAGDRRHVPVAWAAFPYETIVRWTPALSFVVQADKRRVVLAGPSGSDRGTLAKRASAPDVSSDGRLAFVRGGEVYVRGGAGKARVLTRNGGNEPSWSPHGRSIAFTRKGSVHVVAATGGRARRLTKGFNPVWSPDGRQIAFFRAIPDPEYFGDDATYLFTLDRRTGRVRRVSDQVLAVPDDILPNGLDWQVAP